MNGLLRPMPLVALLLGVPLLGVWLLASNGALTAGVVVALGDPGPLATWGLPVSRGVRDVASALTIGLLVLVATAAPPTPAAGLGDVGRGQLRMLTLAAVAGFVWVWANIAVLALTYANLAGRSILLPGMASEVVTFATTFEAGRLLAASVLVSMVAAIGAMFARRVTHAGVLALVALAGLWPLALSGHAAGTVDHDATVNVQYAHLVAVTVWVGGLAGLYATRRQLGGALPVTAARFSRLAGASYAVLVVSGVVAATLRLDDWSDLNSDYGALLLAKAAVLGVLGLAGWRQRSRVLPRLAAPGVPDGSPDGGDGQRAFIRLVGVELVLMTVALGAAVALAATPPPVADRPLSAAEGLLGHEMPPPLTAAGWFTSWRLDTFWTPAILGLTVAYLVGVRRLRARGDRWPVGRLVCWLVGAAGLVWATSGAPGVYGEVLFSTHMVQHMIIATAVPTFLCLGAPVTLALRALRGRRDGSRGPREWLLLVVHSWWLRLLGQPLVAAGLFITGLVAFYYSALFELSLRSHTAHLLMVGHFLFSGYLFASVIVGVDPGVRRPAFPLRMLLLMVTFGFHAFFSVSLMGSQTVLARDWFAALGRDWGPELGADQYVGASLGWALGDFPLAILAGALIAAWVRADRAEGRRLDRQADRDDDAQLRRYNETLLRLQSRNGPGSRDSSTISPRRDGTTPS